MRSLAAFAFCVYACAQPVDRSMYARIREEGFKRSQVMVFAEALIDGIGPRLTGSPNLNKATEWARQELGRMGCTNVRSESWGEFGMGWRQRNVWLRMTHPDEAVMIAQAAPWSPATPGPVRAEVVEFGARNEKDFEQYRGKLAGKVVLFGSPPDLEPPSKPMFQRLSDKELAEFAVEPSKPGQPPPYERIFEMFAFRERMGRFLAGEKVAAILTPAGPGGGILHVDSNFTLGWDVYRREHAMGVPVIPTAVEHYGRIARLVRRKLPVQIELQVDTEFTGDRQEVFNTFADIAVANSNELVLVGAHLDSWAGGTGAVDNGAGVAIVMEAMRILNALKVQAQRTIRLALWTGEEQGALGSRAYIARHVAELPTEPSRVVPEFLRRPAGRPKPKDLHGRISAVITMDAGSGRVRGVSLSRNAALAPIFRRWLEPLRDLGVTMVSTRSDCGSDCAAFEQAGIPTPSFKQDPLDYYTRAHHTNMDVLERLQPADMQQAAVVLATVLYDIAMRDQVLPRLPLR